MIGSNNPPPALLPSLTASSKAEMQPEVMNLCCVAWVADSSAILMGNSSAFRACRYTAPLINRRSRFQIQALHASAHMSHHRC